MSEQRMPLTIQGLKGLDGGLQLQQGEITVLMGPNGAGKTRFMEIVAGMRPVEEWQITYGQEKLWVQANGNSRKRRRNSAALLAYSYACQAPEEQLFARSVAAELDYVLQAYALPEAAKEQRIDDALRAVGWDRSWLQRDPYQMSGGERRRAALACMFAVPASWLLLDEPTAGLDAAGHALLAEQLNQCKAGGQGVLLISHDSDWALALADSILLMRSDGRMLPCNRDEILANPGLLEQSGMTIPDWLIIVHEMWKRGVPSDEVWDPAKLAAAMRRLGIPMTKPKAFEVVEYQSRSISESEGTQAPDRLHSASQKRRSPLTAFDPRSVWLAYILLTTGMFMQRTWSGVAWSALLAALAVAAARIPLRRWRGPILALGMFAIILSFMAGLVEKQTGGSFWSWASFLDSLLTLSRPWLAMLIGLGLPLVITPLRLRRSLEQLFSYRGRVPLWGQKIILTITLLLRFIPVLLSEWERFSRISIARGKVTRRSWRGAAGRLRDTSIPFMLALFRLGEHVANALESRGVGKRGYPETRITELWQRRDSILIASCLVLSAFLWWWSIIS
ncbi:ATP-binding cassette domain-containing protein [Paenibacillus mendelii]|uniref:ATP-binding cassette domain-containing protein n=1 Tax=Paenibacillus mendelii TaxID=206163 RepID=A0ABV6J5R3_9BACL|nr:ATP-binding cassette domain-containing protein [Paenibacillus mendelii]MCQ6560091.1 ATP-binding cassette domain-containing protein [Paenibacillus mendelii]